MLRSQLPYFVVVNGDDGGVGSLTIRLLKQSQTYWGKSKHPLGRNSVLNLLGY